MCQYVAPSRGPGSCRGQSELCSSPSVAHTAHPATRKTGLNTGFIEKLIARLDRLDPRQVQKLVDRLVRERGFLENVFQSLEEGVLILDPDGAVTFLNRAACGFFGLREEESVGQPLEAVVRGLDWNSLAGPGRQAVNRDLEVFYPENRFLNFYLSPLVEDVDGQEELLGYVMLVRDITQSRRETEETIESEKLNALTLLAAGVAHEIGNPLNSLGIHLQLLERKIADLSPGDRANLEEHLTTAQNEIQRLDSLLKEFLHAIRPATPIRKSGNLNKVIEDTLALLAPEMEERNVSVHLNLDETLPSLPLDGDQMKQAFFNLLKNSYQALPGSGGEVHIDSVSNEFEIVVSVKDNGSGISPELMGSLFEPFRSGRASGTGLGLLIVRRIVREHGGEIKVESEEGKGTSVHIYLPLVEKRVRL
ncbi:MAG TPA: PAS domain-containing sensor histidine kinase, partial [Verrucomicrobiales bacterium]|nr:PAS domain-containing sensor histidine kinase [Verrucomicrobiales bacterium]